MLFEYSLLTDKKEVEPLSDFLMDKGAYSVSIEDADAETEREKPIFGEPGIEIDDFAWDSSRLKVLCGDDFDMEGALEAALKEQGLKKPVLEGRTEVPDNDWVRITQAQFTPTQIAGGSFLPGTSRPILMRLIFAGIRALLSVPEHIRPHVCVWSGCMTIIWKENPFWITAADPEFWLLPPRNSGLPKCSVRTSILRPSRPPTIMQK